MKMWKGNRNNTILLFSLKGLEILHLVMEHFNSFLFPKSKPANKQQTYQPILHMVDKGGTMSLMKRLLIMLTPSSFNSATECVSVNAVSNSNPLSSYKK